MSNEEISSSNKIKYLLNLHSKDLRKLDAQVARVVFCWRKVGLSNNEHGDWMGIPPDGELTIVPNYSSNKILAQAVINQFSNSSRLKIQMINRVPKLRPKTEHEAFLDRYFCWEYYSPKTGNFVQSAWAERATMEEAICAASVSLAIFLSRIGYWPKAEK